MRQLRTGSIDLAFGYGKAFSDHVDMRHEPQAAIRTSFFVRQGRPILDLADVGSADLVSPSLSRPYEAFIKEIYEENAESPKRKLQFIDSFPLVSRIVQQTDAIGFVALTYTRSRRFREAFAVVPILENVPVEAHWCAVRRRWTPRPAVRAFISVCRGYLLPEPTV